jgi:hypothetical protein
MIHKDMAKALKLPYYNCDTGYVKMKPGKWEVEWSDIGTLSDEAMAWVQRIADDQ